MASGARLGFGYYPPASKRGIEAVDPATFRSDLERVLDVAAEHFGSVWISDHFVSAVYRLECWTLLTWIAARYPGPMLGTHVMANSHRHPAVMACMAASLQELSGGRLILGYGAASGGPEHEALGLEFPPARERVARMLEGIRLMRRLWTEPSVTHQGEYYRLKDVSYAPRPRPVPPIAIGGEGERYLLRAVAEEADWWVMQQFAPEELRRKMDVLAEHCQAVGRDVGSIRKAYPVICFLAETRAEAERRAGDTSRWATRPPFVGEPAALRDDLEEVAALGVDHVQMVFAGFPGTRDVELFVEKVMPHFG